jgi:hypothetical protein
MLAATLVAFVALIVAARSDASPNVPDRVQADPPAVGVMLRVR